MALSAPLSYVDRDRVSVGNSLDDPVPVRLVGEGGVVGTEVQVVNEVEVKNDVNAPLNVAAASLPLPTGAATEAKQLPDNHQVRVSNFPATQVVSATDLDIRNLSSTQDSVNVGNFPATQVVVDGGGSLTVDGTIAVSNFPAVQPVSDNGASLTVDNPTLSVVGVGAAATAQRVQLADESLAALESVNATVSGTVNVGNTVVVSATDLDIRNLSSAQDSISVTGTVALDSASLAALETINVGNFPATQAVSGTVTANLGALNGAATAAKQLPDNHQVQVSNFPATQVVSGSVNAAVTGSVNVLNQLVPQAFSQIDLTYNLDGTVSTAIYKQGATTVATLTLSYTLGRLTSVVRS